MSRNEILSGLKIYKQKNGKRYGIKSLGIFGSLARQEQTKTSDIDIIIELEKAELFIMSDIKQDIEEKFNCHVDIIRKHHSMNPLLAKRISKEAVYV